VHEKKEMSNAWGIYLGNFKVIGDLDQYPLPDVVINVERHSDDEVLFVLVQRIKQLNISK